MRNYFFALLLCISTTVFSQKTLIYCGQLIDVNNLQVLKDMTIVTDGNKIVDVVKGYTPATKTDKTIDLKNKTVMPGLMDMHVHMEHETNPNRYLQEFTMNPADHAFESV